MQLEQTAREVASFKRQLAEVSGMLDTERAASLTWQTKLTSAQNEADVRSSTCSPPRCAPRQVSQLTVHSGGVQERVAQLQAQLQSERQLVASLKEERDANTAAMQALQQETDRTVAQLTCRSDAAAAGAAVVDDVMADAGDQNGRNNGLNVAQMTIQEIKEWLTDHGHEEEVWALASRKAPRVKKGDWLELIQSKQ